MGELPQLLNALRGGDAEGRRRALERFARFDPPSYLPALAERFPFLCNDWSLQVREAFVARMHALGPAAGTPSLLAAAVSVLDRSSDSGKLSALRVIRYLGPPAAHRGLFDRLTGLFCGTSAVLARAAGAVLRNVGPLAARPVLLARLRELLDREAPEDREFALEILAGFGAVPLPPGLPGRIAYLWVREAGASGRSRLREWLRNAPTAAATPEFIEQLARGLRSDNPRFRQRAAEAFLLIGPTPLSEEAVEGLAMLLVHPDPDARWAACEVVEAFGPVLAGEKVVLDRLAEAAYDPHPDVQYSAITLIGRLAASVGLPPGWLEQLDLLPENSPREIQEQLVRTLSRLPAEQLSARFRAKIGAWLLTRLRESDPAVCEHVLGNLLRFGPAVLPPMLRYRLGIWLGDRLMNCVDPVCRLLPTLLKRLGDALLTEEFACCLSDGLDADGDEPDRVRRGFALEALHALVVPEPRPLPCTAERDRDWRERVGRHNEERNLPGRLLTPELAERLIECLRSGGPEERVRAGEVLRAWRIDQDRPSVRFRLAELDASRKRGDEGEVAEVVSEGAE